MKSDFIGPINIGSEEMVSINQLVEIASRVANKSVNPVHKLDAPVGVRGRNSDNTLIREVLGWDYEMSLSDGISKTYKWIHDQIEAKQHS
jgi:GDP-D-mannose 3', 5'-epimerase